jgi:hypothetical protein
VKWVLVVGGWVLAFIGLAGVPEDVARFHALPTSIVAAFRIRVEDGVNRLSDHEVGHQQG